MPASLQPFVRNHHIFRDIIGEAEGYLLALAGSTSEPYYLHSDSKEKRALLYGVLVLVKRRLSTVLDFEGEVVPVCLHHCKEAVDYFQHTLSDDWTTFPDKEEYQVKELRGAVGQELRERNLQELPQMVDKVQGQDRGTCRKVVVCMYISVISGLVECVNEVLNNQEGRTDVHVILLFSLCSLQCVALHQALQSSPIVLLCGDGCTGKSTVRSVLAAAYRDLRAEGGEGASRQYPRVKTTMIHPMAHTLQEVKG